jgi:hypothetical protein
MQPKCFTYSALAGGILVVATSAVAVSPSANPAAQAKVPATVATDLAAIAAQCSEVGGRPRTADALKTVDLNGDGNDDYVLDVGSVSCDGAASIYGDREKGVAVYVGDANGATVTAFSDSVFGAKIEGSGAAAKLWLTVSGAQCGKKPAADFASEAFCDRALTWNATTSKFDYAPVSTVRMVE